jgi:hypothetical protein
MAEAGDNAHNLPGVNYKDLVGETYEFATGTKGVVCGVLNQGVSNSDVSVETEDGQKLKVPGVMIRRQLIERGRDLNAPVVYGTQTPNQQAVLRAVAQERTAKLDATYCKKFELDEKNANGALIHLRRETILLKMNNEGKLQIANDWFCNWLLQRIEVTRGTNARQLSAVAQDLEKNLGAKLGLPEAAKAIRETLNKSKKLSLAEVIERASKDLGVEIRTSEKEKAANTVRRTRKKSESTVGFS